MATGRTAFPSHLPVRSYPGPIVPQTDAVDPYIALCTTTPKCCEFSTPRILPRPNHAPCHAPRVLTDMRLSAACYPLRPDIPQVAILVRLAQAR